MSPADEVKMRLVTRALGRGSLDWWRATEASCFWPLSLIRPQTVLCGLMGRQDADNLTQTSVRNRMDVHEDGGGVDVKLVAPGRRAGSARCRSELQRLVVRRHMLYDLRRCCRGHIGAFAPVDVGQTSSHKDTHQSDYITE